MQTRFLLRQNNKGFRYYESSSFRIIILSINSPHGYISNRIAIELFLARPELRFNHHSPDTLWCIKHNHSIEIEIVAAYKSSNHAHKFVLVSHLNYYHTGI